MSGFQFRQRNAFKFCLMMLTSFTGCAHHASLPLHKAAFKHDIPSLRALIAKGADVNSADDKGWTALHFVAAAGEYSAALADRADAAELLIESGADVNARNKLKWTPLHTAAWAGNARMAQVLLDHGAEVDALEGNGRTPLQIVAFGGHEHMTSIRIPRDPVTAEVLIAHGADVNAKLRMPFGGKWSVLHIAIVQGRPGVARVLARHGAIEVGGL